MRPTVCIAGLVLLAACHVDVAPTFVCASDAQCVDGERAGTCEPDGYCAFPDASCTTGSRYDDTAGDLKGMCIAPPTDWWDPAWPVRFPLSIANATPQALPAGFQVALRRDLEAAPCLSDSDGRIVFGTTELERVVDSVQGPDEWIWFRIAVQINSGKTAKGYWLYCGNPSPPAAPADPTLVFDRYEPFDTFVNWMVDGHVTFADGELDVGGNGYPAGAYTNDHYGPGIAVDAIAASPDELQQYAVGIRNGKNRPTVEWEADAAAMTAVPVFEQNGPVLGNAITIDPGPHLYGVEYETDRAVFRFEGAIVDEVMFLPAPPMPLLLEVGLRDNTGSATAMQFDMMRIRATAYPIPEVAIGVAQPY